MKYSACGAEASATEYHFANNQWGSLLQITNQKCARNVKSTMKTSDMALLLIQLVESFAISICHPRRTRICDGHELGFL